LIVAFAAIGEAGAFTVTVTGLLTTAQIPVDVLT
jgi:hypothetical protein